jgi:hypothetical protein
MCGKMVDGQNAGNVESPKPKKGTRPPKGFAVDGLVMVIRFGNGA